MKKSLLSFIGLFLLAFTHSIEDPQAALKSALQSELETIISESGIPGMTMAIRIDRDSEILLAAGYAEKGKVKMNPSDRMPGGSTGKMYVSAIALELVQSGRLDINEKISSFFTHEDWLEQLPNGNEITVRDLMKHTSGLPRYIFQPEFIESIKNTPLIDRSPEQCIAFVLNKDPLFRAGGGFAYSDTNYLILGLIIETITGQSYNDLLEGFISKHNLTNTNPAVSRKQAGLVQGYIGSQNFFGLPSEMLQDGLLAINPAFEWTGGGTITNVSDLAGLAYLIHNNRLLDSTTYEQFVSPVHMRSGQPHYDGYGLGTFVWSQGGDLKYGHSGFFPGYQTHVEYSTDKQYSIAIQINTDEGMNLQSITYRLEKILDKYLDRIDELKIRQNFSAQEDCWNDHNIECYMEAYAPNKSIQTASRGGITYGYDNIIANYKQYFPKDKMGELFFDNISLRKLDNKFYHVTGRFNLRFPDREPLSQGWFSATLEKIHGQWYMITDHSS